MKQKKNFISLIVAVATGVLVGFVFGTAFGVPNETLSTSGLAQGNISALAKGRLNKDVNSEIKADSDTVEFTAIDNQGQTWHIQMVKEK